MYGFSTDVLGLKIILVRGFVKFVPAVAYHNLPQLACNIVTTTYKYYFLAQYMYTVVFGLPRESLRFKTSI